MKTLLLLLLIAIVSKTVAFSSFIRHLPIRRLSTSRCQQQEGAKLKNLVSYRRINHHMARNNYEGIDIDSATPTVGDMTLYLKAGPDEVSVGDCPFAQYIRMLLEEKELPYYMCPTTAETKPDWLVDNYGGSLPALRHGRECYVESDVICQYLEFFFPKPSLNSVPKAEFNRAQEATNGLFPAVATYLKYSQDDSDNEALQSRVCESLEKLNLHLVESGGPYLTGEQFTSLDCALAPKLHHLVVGLQAFKNNAIDISTDTTTYPKVHDYISAINKRPSFQKTLYPDDTIIWGWTNARTNT